MNQTITRTSFLLLVFLATLVSVSAQSHDWRRANRSIPAGAVEGGKEDNGAKTYICRVEYRGSFVGGKALADRCYYNPGSSEISASRFEVLIGTGYSWTRSSSVSNAVVVGGTSEENFYVCRVSDSGGLYPGRTENGRCYYTRNNRGYSSSNYETLRSSKSAANLLSAAARGDYREVRDAIRDGQAIDQRDSSGRTALMLAAEDGSEAVIRELIVERPDINARDNSGNTAFMLAALNGSEEVVELLFRAGAEYRARNNDGDTAFSYAAGGGHVRLVETFLDDPRFGGIDAIELENALLRSSYSGRVEIMRLLVRRGVNPEAQGPSGRTALMQAAAGSQPDAVRFLLNERIYAGTTDDLGNTAFIYAVLSDSEKVLRVFVEEKELIGKSGEEAGFGLRTAALHDKRDSLKYLLMFGVDINAQDPIDGNTPLILAAGEGHESATEMLVKFQADLNVQNHDGRTALMIASANSKNNTTKVLVKAGAALDLRDKSGTTALGWAIKNEHGDTRKTLQKAKAKQ